MARTSITCQMCGTQSHATHIIPSHDPLAIESNPSGNHESRRHPPHPCHPRPDNTPAHPQAHHPPADHMPRSPPPVSHACAPPFLPHTGARPSPVCPTHAAPPQMLGSRVHRLKCQSRTMMPLVMFARTCGPYFAIRLPAPAPAVTRIYGWCALQTPAAPLRASTP